MLKPGIHEEIICHFFLLAFVTLVFKGVVPKNKFSTFLIYFLCGVPHQILHYPEVFIQNPINGLINTIIVELLLGVPMIWLIRNKNLQTAIAFHWMVDFVSFTSEMI